MAATFERPIEAHESQNPVAAAKLINSRHRLWITRHMVSGKRDGWRPRRRHRASAEKWIKMLDNQLRTSTTFGGLEFFRFSAEKAEWAEDRWDVWPFLVVAAEQGSDGVSALHALQWKEKQQLCMAPFGTSAMEPATIQIRRTGRVPGRLSSSCSLSPITFHMGQTKTRA